MIKRLYFRRVSQAWATDEDIANAERECGCKLPTAFKDFCRIYNGGFPEERNECYLVPKKFSYFHTEYKEDGVLITTLYGLDRDPLWNFREELESTAYLKPSLLPITDDPFGNGIFVKKSDPDGPVFFRDHELWAGPSAPYLFQVADSLEEFYNGLGPDPLADEYSDEEQP